MEVALNLLDYMGPHCIVSLGIGQRRTDLVLPLPLQKVSRPYVSHALSVRSFSTPVKFFVPFNQQFPSSIVMDMSKLIP